MCEKKVAHNFDIARKLLIDKVQLAKRGIITMLEDGNRDYEKILEIMNEYVSCQKAADLLAKIELDEWEEKRRRENV